MASLWLDVRYALRMMVKAPALTAVLAITLALGIGASTTIFSVVNSVVLEPLPYEKPEQLARVYTEFLGKMSLERFWVSPPEYDDLRTSCRSCASVAAWASGTASLAGGDRPVRIQATYATHTLLPLLGVRPMLGRWYDASEDGPGDPSVVVLGHDVWKRAFGGDRSIIGRKIHLDAVPVTVIGVMPPGFDFLDRQEAWVPLGFDWAKGRRSNHFLNVIARLRPDTTITAFRDELRALAKEWAKLDGPNTHVVSPYTPFLPSHPMIAHPFQHDLVGGMSTIAADDLMLRPRAAVAPRLEDMTLEEVERYLIERALAAQGGNVSEVEASAETHGEASREGAGEGVRVSWTLAGGSVAVVVTDDGPGVADATNLFVPFFTTKPTGSGIGLPLARQIAEAHGGSLALRNRPHGRGAEAVIMLPAGAGR
jgi:hypothetical protein